MATYAKLDFSSLDKTAICGPTGLQSPGTYSETYHFRFDVKQPGSSTWTPIAFGSTRYYTTAAFPYWFMSNMPNGQLIGNLRIRKDNDFYADVHRWWLEGETDLSQHGPEATICGSVAGACGDLRIVQIDASGGELSPGIQSTLETVDCSVENLADGVAVTCASTANVAGTVTKGSMYWSNFSTTDLDSLIPDGSCTFNSTTNGAASGYKDYKIEGTGTLTLDTITPAVNDYILLKDQTDAAQNGIYRVTLNDAGSPGNWRIERQQTYADVTKIWFGFWVTVADASPATTNSGKKFAQTEDMPIIPGDTDMTFEEYDITKTYSELIIDTGNVNCPGAHVPDSSFLPGGPGGCNCTFLDLPDTPSTFTANKWLKVNSGATAIEWTDAPVPDCPESFNFIGNWATSTSYKTYTPSASPAVCESDVVYSNGNSYVCILDHTSDSSNEPGGSGSPNDWQTYWTLLFAATSITWRGTWSGASVSYNENDFITHERRSYIATTTHVSDADEPPDPDFDFEGGENWILVSDTGVSEEEGTWLDNLFSGVFDWITDIDNWDLGDWLTLLAVGGGLYIVGTAVADYFDETAEGDGGAGDGVTYDGTECYTGTPTATTLPEVLADLCDIAGITSYDTSGVTTSPAIEVNMTIGNITSVRNVIKMLSQIYFFDIVDSGGTLKFILRAGLTSVKSLTEAADMGWAGEGSQLPAPIAYKRLQGVDLPKSVNITYFSEAAGHNEMTQNSTMETFVEGTDVYLDVPITLTEDEALEVAELTMMNSHIERMTYAWTSSWDHIDLEPGDVVNIDTVGNVRIVRVDEAQELGLLNFVATAAGLDGTTYESSSIPSAPPETYDDSPLVVTYSSGIVLEVPPLDGGDAEDPHLTLAPHGFDADPWAGCNIYWSIDDVNYNLFSATTTPVVWGKVATAAAAPTTPYEVWDTNTTIQVELKAGSLSSASEADVYNGKNWCIIGEELIGFQTASLVSGTTYNISNLLRGRRGTEVKLDTHQNNEFFVMLEDTIRFPYDINDRGKTFYFKFVTNGSSLANTTAVSAQPNGVSVRPWRVHNPTITDVGSPADKLIAWTGRNQFEGWPVDSGATLTPHSFGGYVVQVITSGSPETIVRTTTLPGNDTWTYTTAMQTADSNAGDTIRIAQIDLRTGPGYYIDIPLT